MAHLKKVAVADKSWDSAKTDLLALGLFEDGELSSFQQEVDEKCGGIISARLKAEDFTGKSGNTLLLYSDGPAKRILLTGLGKRKEFTLEKLRQAAGTAVKTAQSHKFDKITSEVPGGDALNESSIKISQAYTEGLILGSYKFLDYKSDAEYETVMKSVSLVHGANRKGVEKGCFIADSVCFVRDLEAHPSNVTTPSKLALEAQKIARKYRMNCNVFDREKFTEMGMGSFASVAKGTDEPPKFILMEYNGGKKGDAPFAFVGKGITFDTGGISLKPPKGMDEMKFDMCGAAAVLGIMRTVGELGLKKNIIGAIAATENMPGGHATKPGDIVKAYNGKTIEILNTDAEGRLVLADVLAYVSKHHSPKYMVNYATLTGAVIVALGHLSSGVMGTNRKLINSLVEAGENTGERCWELPLWDDYCEDVKSKIADVKNLGAPMQAGTIAGGAFLKEFAGDTPWAHVDIAGTAWWDKDRPYIPPGPSGVGVRLGIELLSLLR
tara:strand:+ start:7019 stop:8506 length:1488 start_codon:yes stop_codon:yes gene_type:complete